MKISTEEQPPVESFDYSVPEELANISSAYPAQTVVMVPMALKQVANIATGGKRKRKFGMLMSLAILPNLEDQEDPLVLNSNVPQLFIDADNLEDLITRGKAEIETMVKYTQDIIDGKITAPTLEDFQEATNDATQPTGPGTDTPVHTDQPQGS